VTPTDLRTLPDRLFRILGSRDFLEMKGLANEVPIFIQTYEAADEDALRRMVEALSNRLRGQGLVVRALDLFDLVLRELEDAGILDDLLRDETTYEKPELFDTLKNYSDPKTRLIPRLMRAIGDDAQLTLLTGAGRVFPFLRTHTILESLQPAMLHHPIVMFFPGEYTQDSEGGSQLRLFGSLPSPRIHNPYYRAMNLDHYRLAQR
jgi:hypothetical protein